jgi:hypothetical protein
MCPHAGQITLVSSNTRVLVNGTPVATVADTGTVAGCPFQIPVGPGTKPQPCVTARGLVPATRVLINGQPALIQTSTGLCQSAEQIPQGPPTITVTQTRVVAT